MHECPICKKSMKGKSNKITFLRYSRYCPQMPITVMIILAIITILTTGIIILMRPLSLNATVSFSSEYLDEYSEFCLYKKDVHIKPLIDISIGTTNNPRVCKIWFLPGKKMQMLNQIKRDIDADLSQIAEQNSEIISDYKIDDDTKTVYIYVYKNKNILLDVDWKAIKSKVKLYNELIYGWENTELGNIINIIEVDK